MKKKKQLELFIVEPIERESVCAGGFPQKQLENTRKEHLPLLQEIEKVKHSANVVQEFKFRLDL